MMENPTKMDDLGVPLFLETSIFCLFMSPKRRGESSTSPDSGAPLIGFLKGGGDSPNLP